MNMLEQKSRATCALTLRAEGKDVPGTWNARDGVFGSSLADVVPVRWYLVFYVLMVSISMSWSGESVLSYVSYAQRACLRTNVRAT